MATNAELSQEVAGLRVKVVNLEKGQAELQVKVVNAEKGQERNAEGINRVDAKVDKLNSWIMGVMATAILQLGVLLYTAIK